MIEVAYPNAGQDMLITDGPIMAYIIGGRGVANGQRVQDGDLVRVNELAFTALEDSKLIVIRQM